MVVLHRHILANANHCAWISDGSRQLFAHTCVVKRCVTRRIAVRCESKAKATKVITFIGKGGAGKTYCAILAAQHYASKGFRTCIAIQSQDPTAEHLLGAKLGSTPTCVGGNSLAAFRLESTTLLVEPLQRMKKVDARVKFSQGTFDEIKGEELSILPGMDSILAVGVLEGLSGFAGDMIKRTTRDKGQQFEVVIYDGPSSEEILRVFGAAHRARWYLRRLRTLAEKTDAGRVALPSILTALESSFLEDGPHQRSTADIWDSVDNSLSLVENAVADPHRFKCFLVTDPRNNLATECALRYWGCAIQAGVHVAGVFFPTFDPNSKHVVNSFAERFAPLMVGGVPCVSPEALGSQSQLSHGLSPSTSKMLLGNDQSDVPSPVVFDTSTQSVTLFLPGFAKSEIKLSQLAGGSELVVEAGDQRRSIQVPTTLRGRVIGAKFEDKTLTVRFQRA